MATYLKKEISEWNTTDLCNWLIENKYPGISELCQSNSISGYDLFFINDDILKNELGLSSFHERNVTMKLINKLINEHLKLNIINSNGDNVILTLDNNLNTSLGELSEYIGGMFNIEPKDILYKDSSRTEVLSPTLKIVKLLILYPRLYKTLNVFNMKDYHQASDENENMESKNNDYNNNLNSNSMGEVDAGGSENESEFQKSSKNNNNMNIKMNFDYGLNKTNNIKSEKEKIPREKYDVNENNRIIYNEEQNMKDNKIIYNDEYDINNKKFRNEQRNYRGERNENNTDDGDRENEESHISPDNDLKYRVRTNYREGNNNNIAQGNSSMRNRKNMNFNDMPYKSNKNLENRENYYYNNNDNYF